MSPKEKAEQLIELFTFSCRECDNSKISALIAADEVMQKTLWDKSEHRFWKEVKQEIQNL